MAGNNDEEEGMWIGLDVGVVVVVVVWMLASSCKDEDVEEDVGSGPSSCSSKR